jgi:hypothetical protein
MKREKSLLSAIILAATLGLTLSACGEGDRSTGGPGEPAREGGASKSPAPAPGPGPGSGSGAAR